MIGIARSAAILPAAWIALTAVTPLPSTGQRAMQPPIPTVADPLSANDLQKQLEDSVRCCD